MKVILSRKGFDGTSGGLASPILPDGTLLSLPICDKNSGLTYADCQYKGVSYEKIIEQLQPKKKLKNSSGEVYFCHLDPDIRENVHNHQPDNWQAIFGQKGSAQCFLTNAEVGIGDLFLYFGWFRQTEGDLEKGTLSYKANVPDLHVIFGYLQIGEIIRGKANIKKYDWHPHSKSDLISSVNNTLYLPTKKLSIAPDRKGFGVFDFDEKRVLTLGNKRGTWKEIPALMPENLYGNAKNSASGSGIYYASIWQEKILLENEVSEKWAQSLF